MKYLLVSLAIFASVSAVPRLRLPNDLCDDCLEGTAAIGDFLISEEEIEFQIIEFIEYICTDPDSFTICSENIVLYWPGMARALFAHEMTVPAICGDIGVCAPVSPKNWLKKGSTRAMSCDICYEGVPKLAQVIESEKNILRVIDLLVGDAYCTEESSGLGEPCIKFVEFFVPMGMPLAAQLVRTDTEKLCLEAVQCVAKV